MNINLTITMWARLFTLIAPAGVVPLVVDFLLQLSYYLQDYIVDFAAEHSVLPLCKMEHSVESITRDCNESPWVVTITKPDGKLTTESFDFVVLCTGALGQPKIPAFLQEVKNIFKGSIVHSSQWKHPEVFDGKTVVVVGNGRGATDAIVGALPYAQEAHQVSC